MCNLLEPTPTAKIDPRAQSQSATPAAELLSGQNTMWIPSFGISQTGYPNALYVSDLTSAGAQSTQVFSGGSIQVALSGSGELGVGRSGTESQQVTSTNEGDEGVVKGSSSSLPDEPASLLDPLTSSSASSSSSTSTNNQNTNSPTPTSGAESIQTPFLVSPDNNQNTPLSPDSDSDPVVTPTQPYKSVVVQDVGPIQSPNSD